jgi:hypothetical protein
MRRDSKPAVRRASLNLLYFDTCFVLADRFPAPVVRAKSGNRVAPHLGIVLRATCLQHKTAA